MPADRYQEKRDFRRTPEPRGKGKRDRSDKQPVFVIQQHDASTMHFDFRLEVDGVLRSWAVPKGPSTDPAEKRLAIPTEDHPLEYADFEGVIPAGEYGAGPVLIWDRGSYRNLSEKDGERRSMADALHDGHAVVELHGEKLQGGYALQRIGGGEETRWLLVKTDDEHSDARRNPVSTQPESVASGRTLDEIDAAGKEGDEESKGNG
ncbi:DNA polymerase ligase N-terminal domain-containing protein [Wenzhouxiangella sp. XN24]|uniref:DNA polymerase ligase N-terminal domain-containing protein n=1 Tax=Wenzhouxiangella sp. XN24 TaxID=2713569 RepID=UPI0013EE19BD|nr:DNA polymerase ligase N-terminal domain-containing protein [Wenzhouxiangella sp. XN24]NGX15347.1 DNA ligase [Wenzhouxiangella sp. XN24]